MSVTMMNAIYVDGVGEEERSDDGGAVEGSSWYSPSGHYVVASSSNTFTALNSFNSVLLDAQSADASSHHLDAQTEEVYATAEHNNVKTKTSGSKEYVCDLCHAIFNNSSNLKSHQRTHTGERPYVCDICNAAFVQSSNLKSHKRVHTGERPYICTECGQSFARSSHLTGHKRTHTGEKPYMCGICEANFTTSTHLRNHMRKHTGERPFACHLCDMNYNQNSSLQTHLLVHTGERPFKCTECSGAFRSKRDLLSHARLHSQVKPFPCETCHKSFKTNQYLQKHLKKCGIPVMTKRRGRPRVHVVEDIQEQIPSDSNRKMKFKNRSKELPDVYGIAYQTQDDTDNVQEYFEEF